MIWSVCMFSMMSNFLRPFSFLFSAWASLTDFSGVPIIERTRRKNLAPLPLYFSLHKRELDNEDLRRWWASWSVRLLGHHRFRPLKKNGARCRIAIQIANSSWPFHWNKKICWTLEEELVATVRPSVCCWPSQLSTCVFYARARALLLCNARR